MSTSAYRDLIAQAVIVIAICAAGWLLLVKPMARELASHEAQIAQSQCTPEQPIGQPTIEQFAGRMSAIKARIKQIKAYNGLADDSSRLYSIIMDLAATHDIQVQELTPGAQQRSNDLDAASVIRIEMVLEGSFDKVAEFVDAVDQTRAFVRPASLMFTPVQDRQKSRVAARFVCEALRFKLPDSLAAIREANEYAQP
jgi:hypothetical protein